MDDTTNVKVSEEGCATGNLGQDTQGEVNTLDDVYIPPSQIPPASSENIVIEAIPESPVKPVDLKHTMSSLTSVQHIKSNDPQFYVSFRSQ